MDLCGIDKTQGSGLGKEIVKPQQVCRCSLPSPTVPVSGEAAFCPVYRLAGFHMGGLSPTLKGDKGGSEGPSCTGSFSGTFNSK